MQKWRPVVHILMGKKPPLTKGQVPLAFVINVFSFAEKLGMKTQVILQLGKGLAGCFVWPLEREIWTAPKKICLVNRGVHLRPEIIVNDRKGRFDVVFVICLELFDDFYGLQGGQTPLKPQGHKEKKF
jgi:hypothetical protein